MDLHNIDNLLDAGYMHMLVYYFRNYSQNECKN